jgi:hypothetical protein
MASQSAPAAAPASQPAAASTPAPASAGPVIASAQYSADPNLRCDLLEVKRATGGALLVRWRIVDTNGAGVKPINYYNWSWSELYYTDPAENKKYAYLTDSDNNKILDVFSGDVASGEQHLNWAKFPAPPTTSTKITVYLPKFMPFEDVPVAP